LYPLLNEAINEVGNRRDKQALEQKGTDGDMDLAVTFCRERLFLSVLVLLSLSLASDLSLAGGRAGRQASKGLRRARPVL
jgi:hypothetical protein